jgi:hypothetical protein
MRLFVGSQQKVLNRASQHHQRYRLAQQDLKVVERTDEAIASLTAAVKVTYPQWGQFDTVLKQSAHTKPSQTEEDWF